jgi:hypothetical protein
LFNPASRSIVRPLRTALAATLLLTAFLGCKGKEDYAQPEAFSFVVYPGARYLGQLTDTTKAAHKFINPGSEPPPTAIYDTDATVEQVAQYYVKEYGYGEIIEQKPGAAAVNASWRNGDLSADVKAIEPLLKQMNLTTDISKAVGTYRAADLAPQPNRPRVTISRPYFDVLTSQVVDRTLILMAR